MDAKQLGNTPAFACGADGGCGPWPGMTLRQYYAGLAMQGLLALHGNDVEPTSIARYAARRADALLDELAKEQNK